MVRLVATEVWCPCMGRQEGRAAAVAGSMIVFLAVSACGVGELEGRVDLDGPEGGVDGCGQAGLRVEHSHVLLSSMIGVHD